MAYHIIVKETRLFALLVSPSALSFTLTCLFALVVLIGASWSYVSSLPFFSTYLSGSYGFSSLLHELNIALGAAFNSNLSYNIAVICFALLVGLTIYIFVESIRHMVSEAHTAINEINYAGQAARSVERTIGLRIGLRAASAFVWLGYTILFFEAILPFCASIITKADGDTPPMVAVRNLVLFIILLLASHIHVLFIRLLVLRPRLFGSRNGYIGKGGH